MPPARLESLVGINVRIIPLPWLLPPSDELAGRAVVVFDVIRAATTIAHALAAGATEVRAFPSLETARAARAAFGGAAVLAGERDCHRPAGFDLGNSPGEMTAASVGGRVVFLTTTNGTRALDVVATAGTAAGDNDPPCYVAALVNATATAARLAGDGRDVVLLCAGSDGQLAEEDLIGAGAVLAGLRRNGALGAVDDPAGAADWFARHERDFPNVFRQTRGARKLSAAGLGADLAYCERLDAVPVVARVHDGMRIRRWG